MDQEARDLLRKLLSRDSGDVYSAVCGVATLRDPSTLDALAERVDQIDTSTWGVLSGGILYPHDYHRDFALRKLRFWHDKSGCLCELYAGYDFFEPGREAEGGYVEILDEIVNERRRVVQCVECGQQWDVFDEDYHFPWWKWCKASPVSP